MRKASKYLKGKHDFKAFQAHDPLRAHKDTVRVVKNLVITKSGRLIIIKVTANGFLYKMVRNIVGTLLAVGSGQVPVEQVKDILNGKDRTKAPKTAPAHGLCLEQVKY